MHGAPLLAFEGGNSRCKVIVAGRKGFERRVASWENTYCQICSYPAGKTCRWSFRIFCLLPSFRSYHWVQMAG